MFSLTTCSSLPLTLAFLQLSVVRPMSLLEQLDQSQELWAKILPDGTVKALYVEYYDKGDQPRKVLKPPPLMNYDPLNHFQLMRNMQKRTYHIMRGLSLKMLSTPTDKLAIVMVPTKTTSDEVTGWRPWSSWSEWSEFNRRDHLIRVRQCDNEKYCDIDSFEIEQKDSYESQSEHSTSSWRKESIENQGGEPEDELNRKGRISLVMNPALVQIDPTLPWWKSASSKLNTLPSLITKHSSDPGHEVSGWMTWSSWSECSMSCGGGKMLRVRQCENKNYCENSFEREEKDCNVWECLSGDWGAWSECEDGWRNRERCDEEWNCELQDEECADQGVLKYSEEWSEWGECDKVEGRRTRGRCTEDFGCEEEQVECDRELSWSGWGPCKNGLQMRSKCLGDHCVEEELQECFSSDWGEWGECKHGHQERTRCTAAFGCESEERRCGAGASSESWDWTDWSKCNEEGFQSRQRCSPEGESCFFEDRECGENEQDNKWTEWGECKSGFQEREKCEGNYCVLDTKKCISADDKSIWTEWGSCGADGRQARLGLNAEFTVTEDRPCDDDEWWMGPEEEVVDYDDWNDGYWESDASYGRGTDGMGLDMESWVAYTL